MILQVSGASERWSRREGPRALPHCVAQSLCPGAGSFLADCHCSDHVTFLFLPSKRVQAFPSCLTGALILKGLGIFQARSLWPEGTDSWPRHLFSTAPPPNWEHSQKALAASWETGGGRPRTLLVFCLLTCCVTPGRSASLSESPHLTPTVR